MVTVTVDGIQVGLDNGSTIMDAIRKSGRYVPYFCYHKKLSIPANCRMCLVEIEGISKVLPACVTAIKSEMVIHTDSEQVKTAQRSVMEFLLINHPLDCPICDQGGECQLQDLAVGYGSSGSRFSEEKRIVFHKEMGPLISAEEMSRCIHCTRCIRFGQEIAGTKEIGMINRGEFSEISSFFNRSIDSELSGNMIDICPVGALTSKPFRYTARIWELSKRFSISPHDSLGSNLIVQVKNDHVMRVIPFENEAVNECWISDRDRFSYDGLNNDRLTSPVVKLANGEWKEVSWTDSLKIISEKLLEIRDFFGANQIGTLASEYATIEEYALLAQISRKLGSENIDFRLRQTDPDFDDSLTGVPWLGMPINELSNLDQILVIGSFLRKDHPLIATRLRQASKKNAKLYLIDSISDDPLVPIAARISVIPSLLPDTLAEICVVLCELNGIPIPSEFSDVNPTEKSRAFASLLRKKLNTGIFLGNLSVSHPKASILFANSSMIADLLDAKFGFLTSGANTIGGYLAGAIPKNNGKNASSMLSEPLKAYVVLHAEPHLDSDDGYQALSVLKTARFSVAMTPYRSEAQKWADIILPISPFTETSGTFINAQGVPQSFKCTVDPFKKTKPAWKILCALAKSLGFSDFNYETSESVRDSIFNDYQINSHLSNKIKSRIGITKPNLGFERITNVPIYRSDPIVRRSRPLQKTKDAQMPLLRLNKRTLKYLSLPDHIKRVKLSNSRQCIELDITVDESVPDRGLWIPATYPEVMPIGSCFGQLNVEGTD